jgi:beta-1,4-N-acetylglucosaminyltransferase
MAPKTRATKKGGGARPRSPARATRADQQQRRDAAGPVTAPTARRGRRGSSGVASASPPPPPKSTGAGGKTAFVTVGTTRFDALVDAVDHPAFEAALVRRGFTRLVVQAGAYGAESGGGRGGSKRKRPPSSSSSPSLTVDRFAYAPSLAPHMAAADLVISHAGAGSLFEALRGGKACVAVPNPALMGDHQGELARTLADGGHVTVASPPTTAALVAAVARVELDGEGRRRTWEAGSPAGIVAALDELAGRTKKERRGV